MDDVIRNVVVVGGGSAGWLTAAVLAAEHCAAPGSGAAAGTAAGTVASTERGFTVTVVESPDVPIIGVGEGTWPTMRDTLRRIGVSESDFLRECDASFKQGSRFDRWVTGEADDSYFHPFVLPHGYTEANLVAGWLEGHPGTRFADVVSVQPRLCAHGKAPKQAATPEFAAVANYAYHFDAGKFAVFLRRHCVEKLGVVHVADHVLSVNTAENGDIASLQLKTQGVLGGDLFVDCTGMQALLIGKHYGRAFQSQKHVLFNDSALAIQMPYADPAQEIASQTMSTAQSSGWIWDIGLPSRRGVGHVFSGSHITDDAAEQELRDHIVATGGPVDIPSARKLTFQPGYREEFWHRNCVAIGLSAGFIEPLEASAIALVELSAAMLADEMPVTRAEMDILSARFNEAFTYRWERVIEFLKLHYVLTQRRDSAFWRDNVAPESIPVRLREQLALWKHRPPSRYDFGRVDEVFPSASYQYILYGMGFRPDPAASVRRSDAPGPAEGFFRETAQLSARMLAALPGNRDLLTHIARNGLPRI